MYNKRDTMLNTNNRKVTIWIWIDYLDIDLPYRYLALKIE